MLVALIVFVFVLFFTMRKRSKQPVFKIILLSVIVVVGGMTFARITYGKGIPWWIFYGIPAFITFVLPPIVLKMSKRELIFYIPISLLMGPTIHVFFSFLFGWHDFMPLFYVPWWHDLFCNINALHTTVGLAIAGQTCVLSAFCSLFISSSGLKIL
ncbi:MAG: hypothetical protein B6D44_00240 [Ignavibacteriales bacterium UTCHB2]|nr:MAG: hypothetical protein B6D44_00240 [Ignavibacteriales bacterium UTCHB2]